MTASDLGAALREFDTATLHEAAAQRGDMEPSIVSLIAGARMAGPALTVACPEGDNLELHYAIAAAQPGTVIVAQPHTRRHGVWGEVMTVAAMARGVAGLVVDGCVRDIDAIRSRGFPVFARGTAIRGTQKRSRGSLDEPVTCGGLIVHSGDYVVGDDSGVVVLPPADVEGVLRAARERQAKELELMDALQNGATTVELLDLKTESGSPLR